MPELAPTLALARAELRVAARKSRWYFLRVALCGLLVSLLFSAYFPFWESRAAHIQPTALAAMASYFFTLYAAGVITSIAVVWPGLVAASVSGERDRRTLDDLLVSPLTNTAIVLGKAAARSIQAASLVVAGLGVLAISSLLGGSDLGSMLRLAVVSISSAWAVTGWSMAVSVGSARTRDALVTVYRWLLLVWAVPLFFASPFGSWLIPLGSLPGWLADAYGAALTFLLCLNPFVIYFGSSWLPAPDLALAIMAALHGAIGAAGLSWAIWRVRKADAARASSPRSLTAWWKRPLRRRAIGSINPMLWKEASRATRGSAILSGSLALLVLAYVVWFGRLCLTRGNRWPDDFVAGLFAMAILLSCAALVTVACRAATAVTIERERDTWISLLSTPLTAREIMLAKLLGAVYSFRWMLGTIAALGALCMLVDTPSTIAVLVTTGVMAVLLAASAALGIAVSRRCASSGRALMVVLGIGAFVGGGYLLVCLPLMIASRADPPGLVLSGVLPFLLMLPGIWYSEGAPPPEIVGAFVVGVVAYSIAALVLIGTNEVEIDRGDGGPPRFHPLHRRVPVVPPRA